jgi:superoxide reductase
MKRREFLKATALLTGSVAMGLHTRAHAAQGIDMPGIIYTEKNQGKWAGKAASHAPKVSLDGRKVTIRTMHPMTEKHFIVRHTLVTEKGTVIGEKVFYPTDKEAVSTFDIDYEASGYKGKLYATSFCNLHDLWVTEFSV